MNLRFAAFAASFLVLGGLFGMSRAAAGKTSSSKGNEEIRVMPVQPTPESNTVILKIAVPREKEVARTNPVWVQFRIEGFSLGADSSQFERDSELADSGMGQTVHVVVDNEPYFAVNEPAINPFNEAGYYYVTSYKFELPFSLKDGIHTIRMFPARSYGESLKGSNTFSVRTFYVRESSGGGQLDLSKPYLTYNEPSDQIELSTNQPILLDFLVSNCELTPDGYKVRLTIDGKTTRTLTSWQPYYIYGLPSGKHTIRLELLNGSAPVPGPFNDVTRTITVH